MTRRPGLGDVREDLRERGYLSHGLDRFLLQDAYKPQRPGPALLVLALRVAAMAGPALALVGALVLAVLNGNLESSPFDLLFLFLHLLVPLALGAFAGFLVLAALLVLVLRLYPVRRIETLARSVAVAAGGGVAFVVFTRLRELEVQGVWPVVAAALTAAVVVAVLVQVVDAGLLSFAIRLTRSAPAGRPLGPWWGIGATLALAVLLVLPIALAVRGAPPEPPVSMPVAPGEPVLLLGLDGVLPGELEYLLSRGELPALRGLLADGGRLLSYRRPSGPPAAFWTTVATGRPAPEHGVTAVDAFRPLGVERALSRTGLLRPFFRAEVALGLAEHRPVLANRRNAFAVWELAARGGAPVAAVNWWATYPAAPLPGLVVAHGAYQLLAEADGAVPGAEEIAGQARQAVQGAQAGQAVQGAQEVPGEEAPRAGGAGDAEAGPASLAEGAEGAIAPGGRTAELAALRRRVAAEEGATRAIVPERALARLELRALAPDRFYRAAFAAAFAAEGVPPRAGALYLPALDIAADLWRWNDLAFADLVRAELTAADRLLAEVLARQRPGTVAVVLDPGRRTPGGAGRVLLWRRGGCSGEERSTTPDRVAAALLRALGLPQSAELPLPPEPCDWLPPPASLPTYGARHPAPANQHEAGDYLENLRSLGYL